MIFFLEIDGKLKKCLVHEPFESKLHVLNMTRWEIKRDSEAWDMATKEIESIAEQVVQAGAYEERE